MTKAKLIKRIKAVKALDNSRDGVGGLADDLAALQAAEPQADYARAARKLASLQASIERRPTPPKTDATMEEQETMLPDWIIDNALDAVIDLLPA